VVTICTASLTLNILRSAHLVYVFYVDVRTNSSYFPIQHQLTDIYNRDEVCLLRGTD